MEKIVLYSMEVDCQFNKGEKGGKCKYILWKNHMLDKYNVLFILEISKFNAT